MGNMLLNSGIQILLLGLISSCCAVNPGNWPSCENNDAVATRSNTSWRMGRLREEMVRLDLDAYIIPSPDFHLSEFVAPYDERRQFISGFTGSAGTAVVTKDGQALWTDGRYFLQAESELGCDWILMREGEASVQSIVQWLHQQDVSRVGACPYFFSNEEWLSKSDEFWGADITFVTVMSELIDQIWTENRPDFPSTTINAYPLKYAGRSWQDKLADVRNDMESRNADALIVTGLDETAWLFNLRANDITGFVNDPFFYSFAVVKPDTVKLFIKDKFRKLEVEPTDLATNVSLADHLNTSPDGYCLKRGEICVQVEEYKYSNIILEVATLARSTAVNKIWVSFFCNYAVYSNIPEDKVYVDNTPTAMRKTQKNAVEVEGMTNCQIRDAAAVASFMEKLEKEVRAGENWTEVSAMEALSTWRSQQELSRGDSFAAISSVGPNAAINHYFATNKTDRRITTDETYLLDSGGQYLDGTTDITRTFLFREPTEFEKECYTRVLMGQINLALGVWNKGLFGREIDAWAREPLLDVGLVYRHGTGHGIGHFLSVHEGPGRISNHHALFPWDVPLDENMFYSNEPGYYEDGKFGIRLENIIYVKKVETKYKMPGVTMLGFETITLFPYEPHLIDYNIMTQEQIDWLNDYNKKTYDVVGSYLKEQGATNAYNWMKKRTRPVETVSSTANVTSSLTLIVTLFLISLYLARD